METALTLDNSVTFADFKQFYDELQSHPESLRKLESDIAQLFPIGLTGPTVDVKVIGADEPGFTERVIRLGHDPLPGEVRIHRHSWTDIRTEGRACRKEVFLRIKHPRLDTFFNSAYDCAVGSAVAAVIAAAATGAIAAAYAIFYPLWYTCMLTKVSDVIVNECSLEIFTEGRCGCWDYHNSPDCALG